MQAVKEKLNDMSAMRRAKAEAKEEEKAEKELAKARIEVAHEVRMAREAEAAVDLHVTKAAEIAEREAAKYQQKYPSDSYGQSLDPFSSSTAMGPTNAAYQPPKTNNHS